VLIGQGPESYIRAQLKTYAEIVSWVSEAGPKVGNYFDDFRGAFSSLG